MRGLLQKHAEAEAEVSGWLRVGTAGHARLRGFERARPWLILVSCSGEADG
jgi:hypothetical protein